MFSNANAIFSRFQISYLSLRNAPKTFSIPVIRQREIIESIFSLESVTSGTTGSILTAHRILLLVNFSITLNIDEVGGVPGSIMRRTFSSAVVTDQTIKQLSRYPSCRSKSREISVDFVKT